MSVPTSILTRQARLTVSPKPSTLVETCAILKTLQSFGAVTHFFNPRYVPALKAHSHSNFYVGFKESGTLEKVLAAAPLTVEVGHDAVDPEEADPFNVRGFWDRKKVERETFRCAVSDEEEEGGARDQSHNNSTYNQRILQGNPYHGPFRVDRLAVSFEDLMKQGAPAPEFADCFQKRHLNEADRAKFEQDAQWHSFYTTTDNGQVTGGLMHAWRESLKSKAKIGQVEAERDNLGT
jgi:hypothetical protein